jgi:hypothetical protein
MEHIKKPIEILEQYAQPELLSGNYELIPDRTIEGAWLFLHHEQAIAALVYTENHPFGPELEEVDYQEAQIQYGSQGG